MNVSIDLIKDFNENDSADIGVGNGAASPVIGIHGVHKR